MTEPHHQPFYFKLFKLSINDSVTRTSKKVSDRSIRRPHCSRWVQTNQHRRSIFSLIDLALHRSLLIFRSSTLFEFSKHIQIKIIKETPCTAFVDGGNLLGTTVAKVSYLNIKNSSNSSANKN